MKKPWSKKSDKAEQMAWRGRPVNQHLNTTMVMNSDEDSRGSWWTWNWCERQKKNSKQNIIKNLNMWGVSENQEKREGVLTTLFRDRTMKDSRPTETWPMRINNDHPQGQGTWSQRPSSGTWQGTLRSGPCDPPQEQEETWRMAQESPPRNRLAGCGIAWNENICRKTHLIWRGMMWTPKTPTTTAKILVLGPRWSGHSVRNWCCRT